jgi:hypothetical protein
MKANMFDYETLKNRYSNHSSWAIWNPLNESDATVIEENKDDLNSKHVLLALNISENLENTPWINFHGGKHDRKIKYACNNTQLRGCYITDLFKRIPEKNSASIDKHLDEKIIEINVELFKEEMSDIGLTENSKFIVFGKSGSKIANYFDKFFKPYFNNEVFYSYHYSYYGISDKEWVEAFWNTLDYNYSFEEVIKVYK